MTLDIAFYLTKIDYGKMTQKLRDIKLLARDVKIW
jgi:hypothetical protein